MQNTKETFLKAGNFRGVKLSPIYYTPEERRKKESIENQTKVEIQKLIVDLTDITPSVDTAAFFKNEMQAIKWKKKETYIELYHEVVSSLSEQMNETDVATVDCGDFSSISLH